jgi:putative nucleotidyltransferase with HDIG domain
MPPLPTAISKILEITRDPAVDAKKLNDIISLDPVLTGKVMNLINSAYYSLPNQITSVVRAIIMLGINTVKNLVLSTAVIATINQKQNFNSLDMEAYWRHSICVGAMAKQFALLQKVNPKMAEEFFVAGLLHDIGKIPFNAVLPEEYLTVIGISREKNIPLHQIETETFEINHCDLGLRIADLWRLGKNLKDTIRFHHNLSEVPSEEKRFIATIALANIVTTQAQIGFSGNSTKDKNEEEIFKITGLSWKDLEAAEKNAGETIKRAEVFLKIV